MKPTIKKSFNPSKPRFTAGFLFFANSFYDNDNWGIFAKNPGDQVQQIDTSLADFDALIMTQYQLVASIAGMPATKLLKTTPKGFNSTGEFEERDYKQSLIEIQENDYKPIINLHNTLYTKSRFGRVIPLQVEFNPIDTPSEREKAEIGNIRAMIAASNIANGITTANEERKVLKSYEGSEYSGIEDEPDDGSLADEDDETAANLLKELYGENNQKQAETDENLTNNADFCKKNAKNDLKDEKTNANDADFKESEHPRDKDGKFTDGGSGSGETAVKYRKRSINLNGKTAKINEVDLDEKEYAAVMEEVDTHATEENKADVKFWKPIGDFIYRFVYDKNDNLFYVIGKKRND